MMRSKGLWALVVGFTVLHLIMAATIPLVDDETYYQLWAAFPSLGYYDHPPMIAWWIAAGQKMLGANALGVRVMSVMSGGILSLLVFRITWLATSDQKAAVYATLFSAAMVPFVALGFAATPDAPSVVFWAAAFWALAELSATKNANWWLMVGILSGLGVLSKFTNLFFGVGLVLWLVASSEGRNWLGSWQLWAGGALAILVMSPLVWWNYQNGWIGLELQFGRIGQTSSAGFDPMFRFVSTTILMVSPLIFWFVAKGLVVGRPGSMLIMVNTPLIAFMIYQATNTYIQGNWMLPAYPMMAIAAGYAIWRTKIRQWLLWLAAPLSATTAAIAMTLGMWPGDPIFPGPQVSFNQMKGWDGMIAEVKNQAASNDLLWVASDKYGLVGQLNSRLDADLPVWAVTDSFRYQFRGEFPANLCDAAALFVSRRDYETLPPGFSSVQKLGTAKRLSRGFEIETYHLYRATGLRGDNFGCNG